MTHTCTMPSLTRIGFVFTLLVLMPIEATTTMTTVGTPLKPTQDVLIGKLNGFPCSQGPFAFIEYIEKKCSSNKSRNNTVGADKTMDKTSSLHTKFCKNIELLSTMTVNNCFQEIEVEIEEFVIVPITPQDL